MACWRCCALQTLLAGLSTTSATARKGCSSLCASCAGGGTRRRRVWWAREEERTTARACVTWHGKVHRPIPGCNLGYYIFRTSSFVFIVPFILLFSRSYGPPANTVTTRAEPAQFYSTSRNVAYRQRAARNGQQPRRGATCKVRRRICLRTASDGKCLLRLRMQQPFPSTWTPFPSSQPSPAR